MKKHKSENKKAGRIIFGLIVIVGAILAIIASGDIQPETQTVTIAIEHEALK